MIHHPPLPPHQVNHVNSKEHFKQLVDEAEKDGQPVVIDFYATWW